jgi:hypothetical protein
MRAFQRMLPIFGSALAMLWLGAAQPAEAGDGADLGALQNYINTVCSTFGMSTCPQLPTITQAVLEVAAMADIAPEAARSSTAFFIPVGPYVDAGNPSHPPAVACSTTGCVDPLSPFTFPIDPAVLSSLRPLAFISAKKGKGPASPTQLYDPSADAFLYAVGGQSPANTNAPGPDTLLLFYDNPDRTDDELKPGDVAAKISLPLTVINSDGATQRAVSAILQYKAPAHGGAGCSASTVTGSFSGTGTQTLSPAAIGIDCAVVFAGSPVANRRHAIFEVAVPILITSLDPAIIIGSGFAFPFASGEPGFTPAGCPSKTAGGCKLGTDGMSIGIGPNTAPAPATQFTCDPNGCSYPPVTANSGTYALCANLPRGGGHSLVPSAAAFYAIAGNGEVLLSAPLAPGIPIGCPAGMQ